MSKRQNPVIEFAPFTLANEVDESTLMAASDALQAEFLNRQKGFLKRDLVQIADNKWADVLYWDSKESVERAMQEAPQNPAALNYFQLMDNAGKDDPTAAMMFMRVVRSYS